MKVTVAIPTFRRPQLVVKAVNSILAAERDGISCSIVVVDNASPEPVRNALSEFGARVQFLRNDENLGMPGNWNRCRQLAQETDCDAWMLLEDDNMLEPRFLVEARTVFERNPETGYVSSACTEFEDSGRERTWRPWAVGGGTLQTGILPRRQALAFAFACPIRLSAILWRNTPRLRGLPSFVEEHYWCADVSGLCEGVIAAGQGAYLDAPLMRYYVNPGSVSAATRESAERARRQLMSAHRYSAILLAKSGRFTLEEWAMAARSAPADRLMLAALSLHSPQDRAMGEVRDVILGVLASRSREIGGTKGMLGRLGAPFWRLMVEANRFRAGSDREARIGL